MTTPRIAFETRHWLIELWHELHLAQAAFVAAQVRVDVLATSRMPEGEDPHVTLKEASERRETVRSQLRKEYHALFGDRGVERVNAYISAFDALYGPSHRLSFVSITGPEVGRLRAAREAARCQVNRLTRRPDVIAKP